MSDKRKWPRKASLASCSIELYSMHEGPYPSRVINYSVGGLMLELDQPLPKGEPLKIRFRPDTTARQRSGESYCLGVVRWCTRQATLPHHACQRRILRQRVRWPVLMLPNLGLWSAA